METVRLGRQLRALRRRQRLTQDRLSERASTSRSEVGRAERGEAERLRVATLVRIASALGARLEVRLSWNGEALDRLLDAGHAALVDEVVRRLRDEGWDCAVEVSFNAGGERGAVDVLAFHPLTQTLLVVEVKSVVPDIQAMLMTLDRKARLGRSIAAQLGWSADAVGRLLVIGESRTSRRCVDAHASLFEAALPSRAIAIRAWLAEPHEQRPLAWLLFLSSDARVAARHRVSTPRTGAHARTQSNDPGICRGPASHRADDTNLLTSGQLDSK
jgi:transcriptional regulator with XRE-family HTH domain